MCVYCYRDIYIRFWRYCCVCRKQGCVLQLLPHAFSQGTCWWVTAVHRSVECHVRSRSMVEQKAVFIRGKKKRQIVHFTSARVVYIPWYHEHSRWQSGRRGHRRLQRRWPFARSWAWMPYQPPCGYLVIQRRAIRLQELGLSCSPWYHPNEHNAHMCISCTPRRERANPLGEAYLSLSFRIFEARKEIIPDSVTRFTISPASLTTGTLKHINLSWWKKTRESWKDSKYLCKPFSAINFIASKREEPTFTGKYESSTERPAW